MPADSVYKFGPFEVDPSRRRLARDGQPVTVPGKAFDVLVALIVHRGRVIEKEELLRLVWPGVVVEEGNLSQHVFTLRKLLGDTSDAPIYVATVPRRGYQFIADVEERQRTHAAIGGPARTRSGAVSLGVLPFAALMLDPDDHFLGYGIAEAIVFDLRRLPGAAVRSASAMARFVTTPPDVAAAGRELGVDLVLHGAVQKRDGWIRVTAQLIDVEERSVMWAAHWEATLADIESIQRGVVARTAAVIVPSAPPDEMPVHGPGNREARWRWMKARFHLARRRAGDIDLAIDHLNDVVAADPGFAAGYASLATAHTLVAIAQFDHPARERDAATAARRAAAHALSISSLPDAHAALAEVAARIDWDPAAAESHFTKAIELDPDHALARAGYALALRMAGRGSEAQEQQRRAESIDAGAARTMQPDFSSEAIAAEAAHRHCVASNRRPYALGVLGYALGRDGNVDAAHEIIAELTDRHRREAAAAWVVAYPFAGSGDVDDAFEWLRRGIAEGGVLPACLEIDPLLTALHGDPRFSSLRSELRSKRSPAS